MLELSLMGVRQTFFGQIRHRSRRWGQGARAPPQKKNLEKYFLGIHHVKFGHFVNFS